MSQLKAWREHLANVRKENPEKSLKDCMVKAKETYKKKEKVAKVDDSLAEVKPVKLKRTKAVKKPMA